MARRRTSELRRRMPLWGRALIFMVMGASLASCIIYPHRASYLRPSSARGALRETGCLGFKNLWLFEYEELRVGVTAMRVGAELEITLIFEVPPAQVVRLDYDALDIVVPGEPSRAVQLSGRPDGVLTGGKRGLFGARPYDGVRYKVHFYRAKVDELGDRESFELYLPSFSVDGQSRTLPAVRFRRRSKFLWILPFNC